MLAVGNALPHNPEKKINTSMNSAWTSVSIQVPLGAQHRLLGPGSLFASEIDRFERVGHGADDGAVLVGGLRVVCIENHLAKLC